MEFDPDYVIGHNSLFVPLIVCSETGFFFSVQTDHHACQHPTAQGFVIPFDLKFDLPIELCEYSDRIKESTRMQIATDIDKGLSSYQDHFIYKIGFDFDKIEELMEGWVPVVLFSKDYGEVGNEYKGYLCTSNCD